LSTGRVVRDADHHEARARNRRAGLRLFVDSEGVVVEHVLTADAVGRVVGTSVETEVRLDLFVAVARSLDRTLDPIAVRDRAIETRDRARGGVELRHPDVRAVVEGSIVFVRLAGTGVATPAVDRVGAEVER